MLVGSSDSPRQNGMEVKSLHTLAKTPPPPHYSRQNHNLWSKIFEVSLGSFCYGLVSCNLCSYSFVESASERQSPFLAKQLSMCPVPMCPCAHVPMCPCAQPRWRAKHRQTKKLERSQRRKEENEQLEVIPQHLHNQPWSPIFHFHCTSNCAVDQDSFKVFS